MRAQIQKTYATTPDDIKPSWYVVDAQGLTLGRLASKIAPVLTGKNKPHFANNLDCGDYVVVINCDKIHVTGRRMDQKKYYSYSGYPGGLSETNLRELLDRHPDRAIKFAVKGMLPKGPLGRKMLKKLKVYAGAEHPHEAQKPEVLEI
ncbi:50S ribosomal protein L13 [Phototrophicus methaneseepsis]|uniref:Large ribosomal subunit protein uL13 n=1 Tax=Phototrophicus methaneseepsis TaxID=2710758 RepID=A0A7S8IFK3_9CHLR|nr:50S ribosomal protein L13 [Phototrophicus methaneseepsis]QPC84825.1 50S ribosomal protein L13 [Phototrophicus methaneseepsis]